MQQLLCLTTASNLADVHNALKHCFIQLWNQKSQGMARDNMLRHARVLPRE